MAKYTSPTLEPIGGSSDTTPLTTLGPVVAAVAAVIAGAVIGIVGGSTVSTPCGPWWQVS